MALRAALTQPPRYLLAGRIRRPAAEETLRPMALGDRCRLVRPRAGVSRHAVAFAYHHLATQRMRQCLGHADIGHATDQPRRSAEIDDAVVLGASHQLRLVPA